MDENRIYDKLDKLDEKIERKFDKLDVRQDAVEKQLIIYNEELKKHIEGVQQLRESNKLMKAHIDIEIQKVNNNVEPIKAYMEKNKLMNHFVSKGFHGLVKLLGFISLVCSMAYGVYQWLMP